MGVGATGLPHFTKEVLQQKELAGINLLSSATCIRISTFEFSKLTSILSEFNLLVIKYSYPIVVVRKSVISKAEFRVTLRP